MMDGFSRFRQVDRPDLGLTGAQKPSGSDGFWDAHHADTIGISSSLIQFIHTNHININEYRTMSNQSQHPLRSSDTIQRETYQNISKHYYFALIPHGS
jgi:hypothetical protein